jgi:hypothetical protein
MAIIRDHSEILLISRIKEQSAELLRKIDQLHNALGRPMEKPAPQWQKKFTNGSRILALPGDEASIRGYSGVHLLAVDEAARVPDELYFAVRPMLATVQGQLIVLSSAYAKLGWFYRAWESAEDWKRIRVTCDQCPRLSKQFLAEERLALGERWYRMEYDTEWGDLLDSVFSAEDVERARLAAAYQPLFLR